MRDAERRLSSNPSSFASNVYVVSMIFLREPSLGFQESSESLLPFRRALYESRMVLLSSDSFRSLDSSDHLFFGFWRRSLLLSSDSFEFEFFEVGSLESSDLLFLALALMESIMVLLSSDILFLPLPFKFLVDPMIVLFSVLLITTSLESISDDIDFRFILSSSTVGSDGVPPVVMVCISGVGVDGVDLVVTVCITDGGCCDK